MTKTLRAVEVRGLVAQMPSRRARGLFTTKSSAVMK
jgi:hypothetical protein